MALPVCQSAISTLTGSLEEVFELSEAGKPFELYARARLKRVK